MKMRYLLYAWLVLSALPSWSQKIVERGHQQFQELAYSAAIISLEKAVERGYQNPRIYTEIADSYYFNANYRAAAKWYQLLFKKPKQILPVHYFRYAQSLKSIGKAAEANDLLAQMTAMTAKQNKAVEPNIIAHQQAYSKNSGRYRVELAPFNSAASDFSPAYFGNQIVFTSSRDTGSVFKRKHSWTNQSFTDLYAVNPDSTALKPVRFNAKINSKLNESTAVFTKDGLTVYFTRNNFDANKIGTNKKNTTLLKIYKAIKSGEDWKVIGALPFCNDNYNVAHPALSPDEKTLYFASDKPGGYGASDLYKVAIESDGSFGFPINLGATFNTFARETFPFVSANQALYFASDGHAGYGGLDVFVSNVDEHSNYTVPQNIGAPINSSMDDFGFIIDTTTKKGYFSSNREGGMGMDDVYAFEELIPLPCETLLEGIVAVEGSEAAFAEVELILLDANEHQIAKTNPDTNGTYSFTIDCQQNYTILTVLKGYVSQVIPVHPKPYTNTTLDKIRIEKEKTQFQIGDDLSEKLALLPIYFDLDQAAIRPDAVLELNKIKNVLVAFPKMTLEIRSHTDSRDTFENNKNLSTRRAQSTLNWLVDNGIDASRLSALGYGETQLLNHCSDGIPCSEAEHQANRRSEFIVTGI